MYKKQLAGDVHSILSAINTVLENNHIEVVAEHRNADQSR